MGSTKKISNTQNEIQENSNKKEENQQEIELGDKANLEDNEECKLNLEDKKSIIKLIMKKFKRISNEIKLSFTQYICHRNKGENNYIYLFNRYREKIKRKFDVIYYLKNDRMTHLVQKLLFTENQKDIFRFLSSKIYHIDLRNEEGKISRRTNAV